MRWTNTPLWRRTAGWWPTPAPVRRVRLRRLLAAGLVALAVPLAARVLRPPAAREVDIDVAAADLRADQPLTSHDVLVRRFPAAIVPATALGPRDTVTGLLPALPVPRGEPLTRDTFLGPGLLTGFGHHWVAVPVRFDDAAAVGLLRAGYHLDVFSARGAAVGGGDTDPDDLAEGAAGGITSPTSPPQEPAAIPRGPRGGRRFGRSFGPLARDVLVVAVPPPSGADPSRDVAGLSGSGLEQGDGGLVVLATDVNTAGRLSRAQVDGALGFAVLPSPRIGAARPRPRQTVFNGS